MSNLLRGRRSYNLDLQKKEHKRKLVIKALEERRKEQTKDKLLMDIISAVPRSTDAHIESVIKKVQKENEHDATRLEAAIEHCRNLALNLSGARPTELWSEPARMVWLNTIEAVTRQSSRWKACPLVMIHPFCGTVEVLTSVCGKHQALSEFTRMRLFADELREGLDEILHEIHPIKDNESGHSLPFEETKEILLDISQNSEGKLSEDEDGALSEDDNASIDLNDELNKVTNDWSLDKIKTEGEPSAKSRLISPINTNMTSPPNASVSLTTTPPQTMNQSRSSSDSSFNSALSGVESPKKQPKPTSATKSPQLQLVPGHHAAAQVSISAHAAAFNRFKEESDRPRISLPNDRQSPTVQRSLFTPDRQVTYKPSPWQIASVPEEEEVDPVPLTTSPRKQSKAAPDLSVAREAYPDGYKVVPLNNRRKSDAKKSKDKKRPVSSPNLPANKQSRMDRTEIAIEQLQLGQANQNAVLRQLADQLGQFTFHLAMNTSKEE